MGLLLGRPRWAVSPGCGLVLVVDGAQVGAGDLQGAPRVLLPCARSCVELAEEPGLRQLRGREWHAQGCCAVSGQGLPEALEKLAGLVKRSRKARGL